MRFVNIYMKSPIFITAFYNTAKENEKQVKIWEIQGFTLEPLETIVDWLERGILPKHSSR